MICILILKKLNIKIPDLIVWLRPTFVFRNLEHVNECIDLLTKDKTYTAARTICAAESRLYKKVGTLIKPDFNIKNKSMIRRQDINENTKFFQQMFFALTMVLPMKNSLVIKLQELSLLKFVEDIDDIIDFEIVECLIKHKAHLINEYFKDLPS